MALVVKDRVRETTSTTGTGTLTLAGAAAGFQSFSSALSDGDTTYYAISEGSTGEWEVGIGTFTASGTTLSRDTVLSSSNSGSKISLTDVADVFITQPAGKAAYFDANGDLILNQDPTTALMAATKEYVDTIAAAGIHYHDPVRVEQEGNLNATYDNGTSGVGATLTNAGTQAALVIDGVTMVVNDRVLIYEQTNAAHNGVYTVTNVGSASTNWVLTRATDADSYGPSDPNSLGQGDAFFVSEGAAGAGETYVMTTEGTITFGTTGITFSQISATQIYSAGNGLTLTGTTFTADAGTGVTVDGTGINIGQAVGTTADVTFNSVSASLTGNVTGNVTGNADTATAWATGRTFSLTGDVTGSATGVDGSGNVSIATTIDANSVALGTDTTGNYVQQGATSGNGISGSVNSEGGTFTVTSNATASNTASTIVYRDASGNFSAGTITADLSGNASSATDADTLDGQHGSYYAPISGADLTNNPSVSDYLTIGNSNTRLSGSNDLLEIYGATSSFLLGVQDGSGRVQMRWNASRGTTPTYLVSNEKTARFEILDVTAQADSLWKIDYADGGTAGDAISYTNIMSLGTTTFTYNGNNVLTTADYDVQVCHLKTNVSASVTQGSANEFTVNFNLEEHNDTTTFSHSSGVITVATAGWYRIYANMVYENTTASQRNTVRAYVKINGTEVTSTATYDYDRGSSYGKFSNNKIETLLYLSANDTVEIANYGWNIDGTCSIEAAECEFIVNSSTKQATSGNADTVDGLHASQFVRSDTSDSMSGNFTVTGDITISGSGNFLQFPDGTQQTTAATGGLPETTATTTSTTQTTIANYATATYGTLKLFISVKRGTARQASEMVVVHNGTTASATEYAQINTGSELASFEVDISGGNVRLRATATSATSTSYTVSEILVGA